jgi:serine protease Do
MLTRDSDVFTGGEAFTMRSLVVRFTASVVALLSCALCFGSAEAGPLLSERIETSKLATVGVLQPGEDLTSPASKTHFTMRGTAVHLRDGFIITARHVVEKDDNGRKIVPNHITVMTATLEEVSATLVGGSAFLDLAVFQITGDIAARLPATRFADRETSSGQPVYTIGYPLGWGPAMGFGKVGNTNTFLPTSETRLLQLDLSACNGNSGGGVFNEQGELVGLMHAIIQTETAQGEPRCSRFGFAVPGPLAQKIVTAVLNGEQPRFSRLGIGLTLIRMGSRWRVAASDVTGPARDGGIQKGDIILAIDNTELTDGAQLKNYLIEHTSPGQQISIRVLRGQTEQVLKVTLGKS